MFTTVCDVYDWQYNNCQQCKKYEDKSTERKDAGCVYAYDIDASLVWVEIPKSTIKAISGSDRCKQMEKII